LRDACRASRGRKPIWNLVGFFQLDLDDHL
jgi:hypothetical protein